jgi:uncharacterized protein (TIRG00374 family)
MEKIKSIESEKILKYGLHLAVLAGVSYAAIKYLNGEELLHALRSFNYGYAPLILLISTCYLLLKGWRFVVLMQPFAAGVPRLVTLKAYIAGQAVTLLPGGIVARAGLMKQLNIPVSKSGVPIAFSSILDQSVLMVGLLGAALWFAAARLPALILLGVITAVSFIALIPTTRRALTHATDWIAAKLHATDKWHTFLQSVPKVLTWRLMGSAFLLTFIPFVGKVIALDLSLRGLDLQPGLPTVILGFILPTMLGRLLPVPGGVGVTEASMVGFLASTAQANLNQLAAAVAIFRLATVFFQAMLGAIVYFIFWDGLEELSSESTSQTVAQEKA